jgi:Tol biopolymer transport system component
VIEANASDVSERGVYVATLDGKLRRIADATLIGLDVSPDGRRVLFLNDHRLFVVGVDGKGLREIQGVGRVVNKWDNPAWSPDGRWVAAIRLDSDGGYRVAVAGADGGAARVLAPGVAGAAALDWVPDSSAVVVASGNAVWSAPINGGPATKLTDTGTYSPGFVEFSPDGTKLAYAVYGELIVMAPDGSQPHKIASIPYGGYFAWSPDSTRLAHAAEGQQAGLAVTAADGSASTTIVHEFAGPARWASSDLIAFSVPDGNQSNLELIRPDGSDRRRFVTDLAPGRLRSDHVWDPTGSWVALTAGTGGDGT